MMEFQNIFLDLIRLGVGHPIDCLPRAIDWDVQMAIASSHSLSAIVLDGAQELSKRGELTGGRSMEVGIKKKWIGKVIQNYEWKYREYQKCIAQLAQFYNNHGFRIMVLKGYGLSLNYPIPQHRPCGDIDIWLFGNHEEADYMLSRELSIPIDTTHHHHTVFSFNGFTVENHYDFVNVHYGHGNAKLEKVFKELAMDDSVKTDIDGFEFCLPSATLHSLFLLRHSMLHFTSTRLNLRQVLDWAFFIEKHFSEVNWAWFLQVVDDFHMTDFFRCINAICIEDLGFNASCFPLFKFDSDLKNRVLNDILCPEFDENAPSRICQRIPFKYRRWQANAWKQEFCYHDSRFKAFWTGVWGHLLKPEMI